jgi:hypothetical protein
MSPWLLLLACSNDPAPASGPPKSDDSAAGDSAEPETCDDLSDTEVVVISSLLFSRADEAGVCAGFDLDGLTTAAGDEPGCRIPDYTSPEGLPGVDNAFARLIPALELTEARAVEGLIAAAIESGELLLAIELEDVDSPTDDGCVNLNVLRATGEPMIGTDDTMLPGQTFDRDASLPGSRVEGLRIEGGSFEAGPLDLTLPIQVLDASLEFHMTQGRVHGTIDPETGAMTGYFGGSVDWAYLADVAASQGVDPTVAALLENLLSANADMDLDGDGACGEISVTFVFEAVPAYFFGG